MKKLLLFFALALMAVPASAADRFAEMDKNGDGQVNWEEFQAALPSMKRAAFDQIDADKSGGISQEEWNAFRSNHGSGGMGMGTGSGMGSSVQAPSGNSSAMPMIRPPAN